MASSICRPFRGVVLANSTCCVPLKGGYGLPSIVMGRPLTDRPFHGGGNWQTVSPGCFEVFRIPVLRGRTFNDRDTAASTPAVVINQAMAKQFWPKSDPLSDQIWIGKGLMPALAAERPRQIIGVVGDIHGNGLDRDPQPTMYIPQAQVHEALNALNMRLTPMRWVVRTRWGPCGCGEKSDEGGPQMECSRACGLVASHAHEALLSEASDPP